MIQRVKRDASEIRRLYVEERLSMKAIAELVGCGKSTIKRDLVSMGVRIRSIWEQRKIEEAAGRAVTQSDRIKQRHVDGRYVNAMTPERCKRMSELASQKVGEKNPFFGKTHSKETRAKISASAKQRVGEKNPFHGRKHSLETRLKISAFRGGDGRSFIPQRGYPAEWTEELRERIRDRDGYRCLMCGNEQGLRKHSVHHVDYDRENNEEKNLATCCVACHCKTNVRRKAWIAFFGAFGLGPGRRHPFA